MTQMTISEARKGLLLLPEKLARLPERAVTVTRRGRPVRAVGQRYRIVHRVERRKVVVVIVALGKRKAGDKGDIYELAKKLLKQGLLR